MATRAAETNSGVTTSWIPFTTPGPTLSPECASAIYLSPQNNTSIGAFDPWYGQNVNTALRCQAAQQTSWWDQSDLASSTLWNLGPVACPNGYTTASTLSVNPISTILACCPKGYDFQNTIAPAPQANECFSSLTSGQVITPLSSSEGTWVPTTMTITGPGTVIHGVQINGWNFATSSTSGSGSSASITSSTSDSTGTGGSNASNTTQKSNGGLSGGAKAGIGVAVAVGVIGICCLLASFLLWKRKKRSLNGYKEGHASPASYAYSPADQNGGTSTYEKSAQPSEHAPPQYTGPVEVSGESRSTPVEIG